MNPDDTWTVVRKEQRKKPIKVETTFNIQILTGTKVKIEITQSQPDRYTSKRMKDIYHRCLTSILTTSDQKEYEELFIKHHAKFTELSWLAYNGKLLIGLITLDLADSNGFNIKNLAVDPFYQKKGIGHKLVESLLTYSKMIGITKLSLFLNETNIAAIKIFLENGFVEEARGNDQYLIEIGMRKVYMSKQL